MVVAFTQEKRREHAGKTIVRVVYSTYSTQFTSLRGHIILLYYTTIMTL